MGYQGTKSLLIHKRPKDARPTESGGEAGAGTEAQAEPETPALVFRKLEGDELFSFLKIQLEYYFSKQNLEKDAYLNSQMDEHKFVPVELIASFPKVKRLTEDRALMMKAMKECKNIQINENETKVRATEKRSRNVLILRDIPQNTPREEILKIFEGDAECSKPISVKSDIGDTWFVTFETEQDCMDTAMHVNLSGKQLGGKNISCRVKSTTSARFFTPSNKQAQPIIPPSSWPAPAPGFPGFDGEVPGAGGKKPRAKKGKKKKNVSPPVSDDDTTKEQKKKQTAKQKWQKKPVAGPPAAKEVEAPPAPTKEDLKKTPNNKQKWVKKTDAPAGAPSSPLSYEEMTAAAAAAALTKEEKQASEEEEAQQEQRKSERTARAAAAKKEKKKKDKSKIKRDRKLTLGEIPNEVPPSGGYAIPFKKYDREMMATAVQALMDNEDIKQDIFGKVADKTVIAKKPVDACQLLDPMPVFYPGKPSKFHAAMPVRSSKALGYR